MKTLIFSYLPFIGLYFIYKYTPNTIGKNFLHFTLLAIIHATYVCTTINMLSP